MASRVLQRSSNASFLRLRVSLSSAPSIGGVFSLSTPSLSSTSSVSSSIYRSRFCSPSLPSHRFFSSDASSSSSSSSDSSDNDLLNSARDSMNFDVLIVGGGPSGLATAIRLKQLAKENNEEISVCLIEKGSEIGAHILSGNVFETRSLDELIPNWKELGAPLHTEVKEDSFRFLINDQYSVPLPVPPPLHNEGNYIISLGALCRWLAQQAEALGVEIYPGFAASEVLYEEKEGGNISVAGVATADVGIGKDGKPKSTFQRGIELRASQTIFAEGARGSLSEKVMQKFNLRKDCDPQTYGIGFKEIWEIDTKINKADAKKGRVMHTIGWPVKTDVWGGSFMYHMEDNKILLGYVIGLDYSNPYLSPYQEFQRWKTHPSIKKYLEGGKCVSYGARVINEGGYQSIPKLSFPGGLLVGCSAGLLNVPKIKGSHTAMKSGIVAAEAIFDQYKRKTHPIFGDAQKNKTNDTSSSSSESTSSEEEKSPFSILASDEILSFEDNLRNSWVGRELYSVRNYHAVFQKFGFYAFLPYGALSGYLFKGSEPWTFRNHKNDAQKTKAAAECQIIDYPKPDNIYSFDLLVNLQRSGVSHNDDQPPHLKIKPDKKAIADNISYEKFAGPESRFCPAKVYEYIPSGQIDPITKKEKMKLTINFTNCIHCKTCAIKTPEQFIEWTVPEGGGGPKYAEM